MSKLQSYVLGFAFGEVNKNRHVLLIHKNKPEWQNGRINGVGGKIEPDEDLYEAMVREFKEEVGIDSRSSDWRLFARMSERLDSDKFHDGPADVFCFMTDRLDITKARMMEFERPETFRVSGLAEYNPQILRNLQWLIPIAQDYKVKFAAVGI